MDWQDAVTELKTTMTQTSEEAVRKLGSKELALEALTQVKELSISEGLEDLHLSVCEMHAISCFCAKAVVFKAKSAG